MLFWVACGFFCSLALLIALFGITFSILGEENIFKFKKFSRSTRQDYIPTLSGTFTRTSLKGDRTTLFAED